MKKSSNKIISCIIVTILMLLTIQGSVLATNEEKIIVKKADKEFLIYYKNFCEGKFQFAFSNDEKTNKDDLSFINSATDNNKNAESNIAYIDDTIFDKFFTTTNSAYIWIKNDSGYLVEADLISLDNVINNETIDLVTNTTKRIDVDTTKIHQTQQNINGVETTVTTGKLTINTKEGSRFYYQLVKLTDKTTKYNELFQLAEQSKAGVNGLYNQLDLTSKFYKLYDELLPKADNADWIEVENMEILQPEDTVEGDQYIVWLKEENKVGTVLDAQFLTSTYKYENEKVPEKITLNEVVKLPVTYDSIALLIILAIIIIAIVIVLILKKKSNKEEKK